MKYILSENVDEGNRGANYLLFGDFCFSLVTMSYASVYDGYVRDRASLNVRIMFRKELQDIQP